VSLIVPTFVHVSRFRVHGKHEALVTVKKPVVEEQLVPHAGTATRLDRDTQPQTTTPLLLDQLPNLADRRGRKNHPRSIGRDRRDNTAAFFGQLVTIEC